MLYPKEDRINNILMFACRTCQFSEPAPSSCVYRNTLSNTVGETAGVTQDVGSDPTVGHQSGTLSQIPLCTLCGKISWCGACQFGEPAVEAQVEVVNTTENSAGWHALVQDWGEDDMDDENS